MENIYLPAPFMTGVEGVQFEEVYSLDEDTFRTLSPVHALIFLFKWTSAHEDDNSDKVVTDASALANVFFMRQVMPNACATQAIVSNLMNVDNVKLGATLEQFKSFSSDLDANMRGLALTNSDAIRSTHNSFSRHQLFEQELRKADDDDDVFHFVGYVPVGGHLYELDGLRDGKASAVHRNAPHHFSLYCHFNYRTD